MSRIFIIIVVSFIYQSIWAECSGVNGRTTQTYDASGNEQTLGSNIYPCINIDKYVTTGVSANFNENYQNTQQAESYCQKYYNQSFVRLTARNETGGFACAGNRQLNEVYRQQNFPNESNDSDINTSTTYDFNSYTELDTDFGSKKKCSSYKTASDCNNLFTGCRWKGLGSTGYCAKKEDVEDDLSPDPNPQSEEVTEVQELEDLDPNVNACIAHGEKDDIINADDIWIQYDTTKQNTSQIVVANNNQQGQNNQSSMQQYETLCDDIQYPDAIVTNPKLREIDRSNAQNIDAGLKFYSSKCRDRRSDINTNPLLKNVRVCNAKQIKHLLKVKAICLKTGGEKQLKEFGYKQGQPQFVPIKSGSTIGSAVGAAPSASGQSGAGCSGTPYTEDYDHCRKSVNAYNAFGLAETAMLFLQGNQRRTQQAELQRQLAESQGNSEMARQSQIKDLEQEYEHKTQLLWLYSAQSGAVVTKAIIGWPTINNLGSKHKSCKGDREEACCKVVANESPREVMTNQGLKGYFTQIATGISAKIAQLLIRRSEIERQLKLLGANIDDLPKGPEGLDTLTTYCQSPQGQADVATCAGINGGPQGQLTGFNGGAGLSFSGTDLSNLAGSQAIGDLDRDGDGIIDRDQSTTGKGLQDFDQKSDVGGFIDNPRGASFGQGNGAGGNGGGGSGGGGGGGGGPGLSQKPQNTAAIKKALSKIKEGGSYTAGKGFYKSSGKRRRSKGRRSADKSRRNLGDLAGLIPKRSGKKSPVGPENIDIFKQITDRYNLVEEQGRVR